MMDQSTFADKVIVFNRTLQYAESLPPEFKVLNPYLDNPETMDVMSQFYYKYYKDNRFENLLLELIQVGMAPASPEFHLRIRKD
jgi:hypothetical protein